MRHSDSKFSWSAILPLLIFISLLVYGLFIHPILFEGVRLPVEVLVLLSISLSALHMFRLGFKWQEIQDAMSAKVAEATPVLLILFAVGVLIGSWIVCGTIPMLIYYGISLINPQWIYVFAFGICILFSLLTGTSWGSAGTIGIVMMGIAEVYGADQVITAAAVVGGSFFGDKMSPLSDTTNIAALATETPLMDHIHAMLYTTGPSAIIAFIIYYFLSPENTGMDPENYVLPQQVTDTLIGIKSIFNFNILLFLPLIVVVYGALTKRPIVLTLLFSAWTAMILAFIFQDFSFSNIFESFNKGFTVEMSDANLNGGVLQILNRGGLYNLIEGITISILIFAFLGILQLTNAIDLVINKFMRLIKKPTHTIAAALSVTIFTNLMSSNQYATSFIIGESFKKPFDKFGIPRKVLSRSIEDAGTMIENLAPWTPSGIFMASTLGVSALDYAPYQFLSLINILIAYFFAFTGIACFYKRSHKSD